MLLVGRSMDTGLCCEENSRSLNRKGMPKQKLQAISDIAVFWSSEGKKKRCLKSKLGLCPYRYLVAGRSYGQVLDLVQATKRAERGKGIVCWAAPTVWLELFNHVSDEIGERRNRGST
jgi:hypothetical protein